MNTPLFRNRSLTLIISLLSTLIVILLSGCKNDPEATRPTYRIGYMICNSEEETLARFTPLTKYLSEKLAVNFEAVPVDTLNFAREIDSLDFTHTNSLLYVMYHRFNGLEILATEKRGELEARSKGLVAVLKTSGIKSLADLKGKTMIFGPMLAPTAFMSQVYALKKSGFSIDDDLAHYNFPTGTFKHEKVIYSTLFGKYDAGAFPYYDYEVMIRDGKIDPDDFTILAEGPLIPYCNFAVTQKVDEKLAVAFKQALLEITDRDTIEIDNERVNIFKRAQLQGFISATDTDFDIVRQMAKETNMPPYQKF